MNSIQTKMRLIVTREFEVYTFMCNKESHHIFSVSVDFFASERVSADCKSSNSIKNSLSFYIKDLFRDFYCNVQIGYFHVHRSDELISFWLTLHEAVSTKIILRPKIVTSDENLRRYKPQE